MKAPDRRADLRQSAGFTAKISFAPHLPPMTATVVNISPLGAKLALPPGHLLPTDFKLTIDRLGAARTVNIVWKSAGDIGVTFDGKIPPLPSPQAWALTMRKTLQFIETNPGDPE